MLKTSVSAQTGTSALLPVSDCSFFQVVGFLIICNLQDIRQTAHLK